MRMFLTRFGENVKVVITGDLSQSDIQGTNGLKWAIEKVGKSPSVHIIRYTISDVVRSALVRELLKYIDEPDDKSKKNNSRAISNNTEDASLGERQEHNPEFLQSSEILSDADS